MTKLGKRQRALDVQVGNRPREVVGTVDERYRAELLEAALRVELGEWP